MSEQYDTPMPCQFCATMTDNGCTVGVFVACDDHWDNPDAALATIRAELAASRASEAALRDAVTTAIDDLHGDGLAARDIYEVRMLLRTALAASITVEPDGFDPTEPRVQFDSAAEAVAWLQADDDSTSQPSARLCSLCPNAAEPDDDWCTSCRAGVEAASSTSQSDVGREVTDHINCTICENPITDGYMYGDGDGTGSRFAHPRCYHRRALVSGTVEEHARAARWFEFDAKYGHLVAEDERQQPERAESTDA